MEHNTIVDLLEKYWEGTSSLQEEQELKDYFAKEQVSPELKEYQPFFQQ